MGNLLQQLQNNEAVLLMYLADELPAEDRLEVEQMLAGDPSMRAELAQLREAQSVVLEGLRELDANSALPVSAGVALRQASRTMKQWHVEQLIDYEPKGVKQRRKLPWWAYGAASAAVAVVSVVVWWGMKTDLPPTVAQQTEESQPLDATQEEQANLLDMTMQEPGDSGPIADAERQASVLLRSEESPDSVAYSVFGTNEQNQ